MAAPDVNVVGEVSRRLPQAVPDTQPERIRLTRYREQLGDLIVATKHSLSEEGSYFITANPTPGTALADGVAAAFLDTLATFLIYNSADINDPAAPSLFLGHINLAYTIAPASATGTSYLVKLDQAIRTPTGGSILLAGLGSTPGALPTGPIVAGRGSVARIWACTVAQMTIPAASSAGRVVARGGIDGLPPLGGERRILFGAMDLASTGQQSGTNPVVIPPGWSAAVHIWWPGNAVTGPSFEPEIGWWER